jgi:nucleotide-binding universal stress UspA family protein
MVGHATAQVAGLAPCPVLMVPRASELWQRRILLASDGSDACAPAEAQAIDLARLCQLPLTLVSVTSPSHNAERKAAAQAALDRLLARVQAAGLEGEALLAEGRPEEMVVATAASRGADLIVVGSRGHTGLKRLLLGSASERIMGLAQSPVLIVPAGRTL